MAVTGNPLPSSRPQRRGRNEVSWTLSSNEYLLVFLSRLVLEAEWHAGNGIGCGGMTQVSGGIYEDAEHNLVNINGEILVEAAKRSRTEVYSRVVGYLRPVAQWNKGKKAEWADRVDFVLPKIETGKVGEGGDV